MRPGPAAGHDDRQYGPHRLRGWLVLLSRSPASANAKLLVLMKPIITPFRLHSLDYVPFYLPRSRSRPDARRILLRSAEPQSVREYASLPGKQAPRWP